VASRGKPDQLKRLTSADAVALGKHSFRLFDDDARVERVLQLCDTLVQRLAVKASVTVHLDRPASPGM
jgi:hypothetical protein